MDTAALLDDPRPGDRGGGRAGAALRADPPRPHPAHCVGGRAGHRSGRGGGRRRPRDRGGGVPGAPGPRRARSAHALPGGRLSRRARSVPDRGGAGHRRAGRDRVPGRRGADEDRHGAPRGRHRIAGRADRQGAQARGRRALPRVAHARRGARRRGAPPGGGLLRRARHRPPRVAPRGEPGGSGDRGHRRPALSDQIRRGAPRCPNRRSRRG